MFWRKADQTLTTYLGRNKVETYNKITFHEGWKNGSIYAPLFQSMNLLFFLNTSQEDYYIFLHKCELSVFLLSQQYDAKILIKSFWDTKFKDEMMKVLALFLMPTTASRTLNQKFDTHAFLFIFLEEKGLITTQLCVFFSFFNNT